MGDSLDPLLPRPITSAEVDKSKQLLRLIYRIEGYGTGLLSKVRTGDIITIIGPLGNGFPLDMSEQSTALLVGGGIGTPPLYELSKQLVKNGVKVIHVLGFQTKDAVILHEELNQLGKTYIATEDGSFGTKGFVTDVIRQENIHFDRLYACGPKPMLRALEEQFPNEEIYLSLEERMACGIGACYACVCKTKDPDDETGYRKICSDGPVFRGGEVIL